MLHILRRRRFLSPDSRQVVGTGQTIQRPWYAASSGANPYRHAIERSAVGDEGLDGRVSPSADKFPPDRMVREPGAVLCRVSRSFLRFGHLELFGKRGDLDRLLQMADFACFREYPHLLNNHEGVSVCGHKCADNSRAAMEDDPLPLLLAHGPPERYVGLLREVACSSAALVAEWMRVGYVQGNMNSDNCLLGGRTLDYGPFGWMERFYPHYQPFTSDTRGDFAFANQPRAMGLNLRVLGAGYSDSTMRRLCVDLPSYLTAGECAFIPLLDRVCEAPKYSAQWQKLADEIAHISQVEYPDRFAACYREARRRKLGVQSFGVADEDMWASLEELLHRWALKC